MAAAHAGRPSWVAVRWLVLLLAAAVLAGCGRVQAGRPAQNAGLSITLAIEPTPATVGAGHLTVSVVDQAGRPVSGAQVTAEGDMTHAGMSPVFSTATAGANGQYTAPFEWTMSGDWVVTVNVTLPDGRKASRQFPVAVGG